MRTSRQTTCACVAIVAGTGAGVPALASGPELQLLDRGIYVQPVRVAPIVMTGDGRVHMTGDWRAYSGSSTRATTSTFLCFDNFEPNGAIPGWPTDGLYGSSCGLGSARWYFGTAFCNMFFANDMTSLHAPQCPGTVADRIEYAWFWQCGGLPSELCLVAVFTSEDFDDTCAGPAFSNTYSGVLYSFGVLGCNPGGYYFTDVILKGSGLGHQLPVAITGGLMGGYAIILANSFNGTTLFLATCAQPMLWGTKPGNPSQQGPVQWDDDNPISGTHSAPTECYTYSFGVCPNPLGAMVCFYIPYPGTGCPRCADFDGNGTINTLDFIAFLNAFNDPSNPCGDYNGNGVVNTLDFIDFLNDFNTPGGGCP